MLMRTGQPLVESVLAASSVVENSYVRDDMQRVAAGIEGGAAFWMQLANVTYINRLLISMARVGEETGDLPKTFEYVRRYANRQFEIMTRGLNKLIEPIITIILGVLLGAVMLSIILPTFALTDLVGF